MNEAKERFAPDKIVKMGSLHPPLSGWRQQLKRHPERVQRVEVSAAR
jgi:hypothetical protein